jgi:hypothetical protein
VTYLISSHRIEILGYFFEPCSRWCIDLEVRYCLIIIEFLIVVEREGKEFKTGTNSAFHRGTGFSISRSQSYDWTAM